MAEARYHRPSGARPALRATEKKKLKKIYSRFELSAPATTRVSCPGTCLARLPRYSENDP